MQRLSIRLTREGSFRVGHDKRHVILSPGNRDRKLRATDRQEAHRKGKVVWREQFGSVAQI